jgi:signal transduction histidine kinase
VSGSAVHDSNDVVTRAILMFRDITELRELEQFREEYFSLITHDLRGPLATAMMAAELEINRSGDAVNAKHPVARIIRSLERMDALLRNLLDAQRIQAGETPALELATCDLVDIAQDVIDELTLSHGARFVLVGADRASGSWNALELHRAIWNLATNAIKYGAKDAPVVLEIADKGDAVAFSITNQGLPIPPAEQAHLFEAYRRSASNVGGRRSQGWGLGLTFVKACATAHGGTISLTSDASHGTTFTLCLPRDPSASTVK